MKEDKEAFAIIQVQKEEVRDLDFVSDASQALSTYCKKMSEGNISNMERRYVNQHSSSGGLAEARIVFLSKSFRAPLPSFKRFISTSKVSKIVSIYTSQKWFAGPDWWRGVGIIYEINVCIISKLGQRTFSSDIRNDEA